MKKILGVVLALITALCAFCMAGCDGNDGGKTKLYVYTNAGFAPYEFINENGEVVGVDIDIMQEIGEILGYEVIINDIEFNQILVEVEKNTMAVGAAGMTKKPDRDAVALASISYATSVQYAIVPANTFDSGDLTGGKLPVSKLGELTKKVIGVQEGTTGNYLIEDAIAGTESAGPDEIEGNEDDEHVTGDLEGLDFQCMTYTNAIVASQDIGTTLGAVVIDKLPAESIVDANNGALECFELVADVEDYVLYFNKNATELANKVNEILQKMIDNGVIDYFTLKHSGGIL
ncbi:MAG: transporter substrate-binding domain-containing protein [Clostridia bacterium]|nr:transporter substrate-binding domain-containing protein [Clostridia bacterium]